MPFGPWETFEGCLLDPKMLEAYPDDEARRRVCGSLQAKLELAPRGDAGSRALWEAGRDMARLVLVDTDKAVVQGATATAAVVNDKGELKPWPELAMAASSLEGVPFVWNHPSLPGGPPGTGPGGRLVAHPEQAPGIVVNVHADAARQVLRYDVVLWRRPHPGADVGKDDLKRNEEAIALLQAGGRIHNSPGYVAIHESQDGVAIGIDGRPARYSVVQRRIRFDHVAGLSPIAGTRGGSCPLPLCGVGADAEGEPHPCGGGDSCCKARLQAAVDTIVEERGCSELEALAVVAASGKGS